MSNAIPESDASKSTETSDTMSFGVDNTECDCCFRWFAWASVLLCDADVSGKDRVADGSEKLVSLACLLSQHIFETFAWYPRGEGSAGGDVVRWSGDWEADTTESSPIESALLKVKYCCC